MFGVDWNDPTTLWLNLTNLGLGLLVLGSLAVLAGAIVVELYARFRVSQRQGAAQLQTGLGPHAIHTPELGLTMADGGEPVSHAGKPTAPARKR